MYSYDYRIRTQLSSQTMNLTPFELVESLNKTCIYSMVKRRILFGIRYVYSSVHSILLLFLFGPFYNVHLFVR